LKLAMPNLRASLRQQSSRAPFDSVAVKASFFSSLTGFQSFRVSRLVVLVALLISLPVNRDNSSAGLHLPPIGDC
jgi:hypothetical protein